jgi:protein-L-isoaspartate(D-aspartate) O-methyltransferase
MVAKLKALGLLVTPAVIEAFEKLPRHIFVPSEMAAQAYGDHALPIGHGQTITQVANVARSVEMLELKHGARVLEIGTGSGYQTGILAMLTHHVFSLEVIPELAAGAQAALKRLGFKNVSIKVFDGSYGWNQHAPYDGIVVAAAAPEIPATLVSQLKPAGRLIVPVGPLDRQQLLVVRRLPNGRIRTEDAGVVTFVPLVGKFGQPGVRKEGSAR